MASSLESLLADEGFTPTSSKPRRTSATTARSVSMPIHPSLPPRAAARTRSDVDRPRSDERRLRAQRSGESSAPVPSLNEAAVKAVVSIIRAHPRRFLKDADFRGSIHRRCFACLSLDGRSGNRESVVVNLARTIEVVERASEGGSDPKELKRASLQLSMITDLGADKDGSNVDVTACAHLYLGVVYGLRRKDRASARHLMQVFNDSPFNARTTLLPELWDRLFRPQFAHLDEWFQAESVEAMPRKARMLEKVYNGALDAGTVRFALYYKEWLADVVVEAPDFPSVAVPSKVLREVASPGILASPMISRRLYEAVFSGSKKSGVDDEREEVSVDMRSRISDVALEGEGESALSPNELGMHNVEEIQEEVIVDGPPFCVDESVLTPEGSSGMNGIDDPEVQHVKNQSKDVMSWRAPSMCERCVKPNELTLKKLAQEVFHQDSCEDAVMRSSSAGPCENHEHFDIFSSIPNDFVCPLTSQLFEEPVTLETGQTVERVAYKEWLDRGNKTCPITGRELQFLSVPITNLVLKRIIDKWKSDRCKNLLVFATELAGDNIDHHFQSKDEAALFIVEQLLTGFSNDEGLENARHLISLGGLSFLIRRLELGDIEERTRVVELLCCCIRADGGCRNYLAQNINRFFVLDLLLNRQAKARTGVVSLLIELICLNRRMSITLLLRSFQKEGITNAMRVILAHLQTAPPYARPLVAVLLLHLDQLVERQRHSIYREEAVDAIAVALEFSLTDEKVLVTSCRALLMLGGYFSFSGDITTMNWMLNHAGYCDNCRNSPLDIVNDSIQIDEAEGGEEEAKEEWSRHMTIVLLGNGKKSFLEALSKCLGSGNSDLRKACLTTVAWLSHALASVSDAEFQLSAFLALISHLKVSLENEKQVEHRVLASLSLLNFSKISECRVLLMTFAEEIRVPLSNLVEVTWTAKHLQAIIFRERVDLLAKGTFIRHSPLVMRNPNISWKTHGHRESSTNQVH